jgi:hypothetical protein
MAKLRDDNAPAAQPVTLFYVPKSSDPSHCPMTFGIQNGGKVTLEPFPAENKIAKCYADILLAARPDVVKLVWPEPIVDPVDPIKAPEPAEVKKKTKEAPSEASKVPEKSPGGDV